MMHITDLIIDYSRIPDPSVAICLGLIPAIS